MDWTTMLLQVILMTSYYVMINGRISKDFEGCTKYFLRHKKPLGFPTDSDEGIREICQNENYNLPDVFATLYHSIHKIPIYSAYVMDRNVKTGRPRSWHTEHDLKTSEQAKLRDYKYNNFDRGHLCPSIYVSKEHRPAAFLLTNAVPQYSYFNQHIWNKAEQEGQKLMLKSCGDGAAYFITGAIPGKRSMVTAHGNQEVDTGVTIPTEMFTAACCMLHNGNSFSFGYLGKNVVTNKTTKYKDVMEIMDVKLLGQIVAERFYQSLFPDPIHFFNEHCNYANKTAVKYMAEKMKVNVTVSSEAAINVASHSVFYTLFVVFYILCF